MIKLRLSQALTSHFESFWSIVEGQFLDNKIAMTFLDNLNSPKFDFMQNGSGGKMIKFHKVKS